MILRTSWLKEKFKIWVAGKMTMPTRKILGCIETVDFQHMQLWIHWRFPLDGKGSACFVRKSHIHWGKFIGETGCRLLEMQISGHVVSKAFITDFLLFFFLFSFLSILILFHIQMMKELERMVIKKKKEELESINTFWHDKQQIIPTECVHISIFTLFHPTRWRSGWWPAT